MYYFKAYQDRNKIIISTNTHWNCRVDGNCLLSKCSGIGNDIISITVPKQLVAVSGRITFTYGDERCNYPTIDVYYVNDCFIETIPAFSVCEEGNILVIPFYRVGEMIKVIVLSNDIWTVGNIANCKMITKGDELVIIPTSISDGSLEIIPNIGCKENHVKIKIKYSE